LSAEAEPKPLPFLAIFPDTNIFLPRWPSEPSGLADLLSTAAVFKIPVYLLEAVELELEAHWLREAQSAIDKVKAQKEKLPTQLSAVCKLEIPTMPEVISVYKREAEATKSRLDVARAAFPETTLRKLFDMAIKHEHPFAAEGKNFQDAVIITSVLDFSQREGFAKVAFVSCNRNDFDPVKLRHLASGYNVDLKYYASLDALRAELNPHLDEMFRQKSQKINESAREVLRREPKKIEDFLISQLVKSREVTLRLLEIEDVSVAWWDKVPRKPEQVPFEATVKAGFKVGDFEIDRGVTVDGWAISDPSEYQQFNFESAFISR
jgi:hypothetical protein